MKISAAVLSLIFSGSYISCIVQKTLDEAAANESKKEISVSDDTSSASASSVTEVSVTTEPAVSSAVPVSSVTSLPNTTSHVLTSVSRPVTSLSVTAVTSVSTSASVTEAETTVPETQPPVTETEPAEPPQTDPPKPAEIPSAPGYPVPESPAADSSYFEKCAFIGDSHMVRMVMYHIVDSSRVFAEVGLSLKYLEEKISVSDVKSINPENIYIMMGTNGVGWMAPDYMTGQYSDYINLLRQSMPDAKIYIMSIPPVGPSVEAKPADNGQILNSKVREYNRQLLEMAENNGWYFVDAYSVLTDGNGYIRQSNDGIHMSSDMYSDLKDYILTHTVK